MPIAPSVANQDQPGQFWLNIDDFTPGIYSYSYGAYENDVVPAPLGSCDPDNTWCCSALPQGGLGPLPGVPAAGFGNPVWPDGGYFDYTTAFPGAATVLWVTMMTCNPSVGDPELVIVMEADDGTNHFVLAYSYDPVTGTPNAIIGPTETVGTTPGYFGAPYPVWTRMLDINNSQDLSPLTTPGGPTLVWPGSVITDPNGDAGHLFCYPAGGEGPVVYPFGGTVLPGGTPGTPEFEVQDLVVMGTNVTGQVFGYDGRVVVLTSQPYPWPACDMIFGTNEAICFTDPANSNDYPATDTSGQQVVAGPENPFGYGGIGSISVGELALVKKRGGLIQIIGDITAPTLITPYPGVQSTGDLFGRATSTPQGLVYCSERQGAWVWNGGNAATKMSPQLDDAFFDCSTAEGMTGGGGFPSNNYGYFAEWWGDFVLFSNNYLYNTLTNSWWRLYPTTDSDNYTGRQYFHYSRGVFGNQMFASPLKITSGADTAWVTVFDNTVPTSHYQWQSLPVQVTETRVLDIRRIVLRSNDVMAGGTVTVSVIASDGETVLWTATTVSAITEDPTMFVWDVGQGALGLNNITIRINADNATAGSSAPTVRSLSVAYTPAAHQETQQQIAG